MLFLFVCGVVCVCVSVHVCNLRSRKEFGFLARNRWRWRWQQQEYTMNWCSDPNLRHRTTATYGYPKWQRIIRITHTHWEWHLTSRHYCANLTLNNIHRKENESNDKRRWQQRRQELTVYKLLTVFLYTNCKLSLDFFPPNSFDSCTGCWMYRYT